jgi:hypothetical protein
VFVVEGVDRDGTPQRERREVFSVGFCRGYGWLGCGVNGKLS